MKISIGNGTYKIGDKTYVIAGLPEGYTVDATINASGNVKQIEGFTKDSSVTVDDIKYTAPYDDADIIRDETDWYFDGKNLALTTHMLQRLEMIKLIRKFDPCQRH